MADENNQNQDQNKNNDQDNNSDESKSNEENKQKLIPHAKFHEERVKRQKLQEELDNLKSAEAERQRKAEEEKGNYQKLYEESKSQLDSLNSQLNETKTSLKLYEDLATERIQSSLNSIKSDDDKAILQDALKGKSLAEQENILTKLLPKFITSGGVNESVKGSDKKEENDDKQVKKEEAKKSGDLVGMLKNAPILNK